MADSLYPGSATVDPLIFGAALQPIAQGAQEGVDIYMRGRQMRLQEELARERLAAAQREEERLLQDRLAVDAGGGGGRTGGGGGMPPELAAEYQRLGLAAPMDRQEMALQGDQFAANRAQQGAAIEQRDAAMNPQYLRGRQEQQSLEGPQDSVQQLLSPRDAALQRVGAPTQGGMQYAEDNGLPLGPVEDAARRFASAGLSPSQAVQESAKMGFNDEQRYRLQTTMEDMAVRSAAQQFTAAGVSVDVALEESAKMGFTPEQRFQLQELMLGGGGVSRASGLSEGAVQSLRGQPLGQVLLPRPRTSERSAGSFDPTKIDRGPVGLENPWAEIDRGAQYTGTTAHARELEAQGMAPEGFAERVDAYNSKLDVAQGRDQRRATAELVAEQQRRAAAARQARYETGARLIPNIPEFKKLPPAAQQALIEQYADNYDEFKDQFGAAAKHLDSQTAVGPDYAKLSKEEREKKERADAITMRLEETAKQDFVAAQRAYGEAEAVGDEAAMDKAMGEMQSAQDAHSKAPKVALGAASSSYAAGRTLDDAVTGGAAGEELFTEGDLRAMIPSNPGLVNQTPEVQEAFLRMAVADQKGLGRKLAEGRVGKGDPALAAFLAALGISDGGDVPVADVDESHGLNARGKRIAESSKLTWNGTTFEDEDGQKYSASDVNNFGR